MSYLCGLILGYCANDKTSYFLTSLVLIPFCTRIVSAGHQSPVAAYHDRRYGFLGGISAYDGYED